MVTTSGVVKGDESDKLGRRLLISSTKDHSAISQGMKKVEIRDTTREFIACDGDGRPVHGEEGKHDAWGKIVDPSGCDEDGRSATKDHDRAYPTDGVIPGVIPMRILPNSSHRDGSIYRGTHMWKTDYQIADRSETRLEAMMLSDPTDCVIHDGTCTRHEPGHMFQIFLLKLAKLFVDGGSVELYGYIAVRDDLDPLPNYIVNLSRDDPIIVEQGSLINMAGPKRGIDMLGDILIEYDMRIKTGEQEQDDLQLIDGVSAIGCLGGTWNYAFTKRIHGEYGAIDLTVSRIHDAVEATVEVLISEVQSSFNLCLGCFIGGFNEEIRLFDGAIGAPRGLKRSVVAVMADSWMDLKFNVGAESSSSAEHCCFFKANTHGHATEEIKTDFGLISVKVTWSTLLAGY